MKWGAHPLLFPLPLPLRRPDTQVNLQRVYSRRRSHEIPTKLLLYWHSRVFFSRCIPDQNLSLVVELQANSPEDSDDPTQLFSKGWTKIDLFDVSNRLLSGRYQINPRNINVTAENLLRNKQDATHAVIG